MINFVWINSKSIQVSLWTDIRLHSDQMDQLEPVGIKTWQKIEGFLKIFFPAKLIEYFRDFDFTPIVVKKNCFPISEIETS